MQHVIVKTVQEFRNNGKAVTMTGRITSFLIHAALKRFTNTYLRLLKKQGHEIKSNVQVSILASQPKAAMEYEVATDTIRVPFTGLLLLAKNYKDPKLRVRLEEKLGRKVKDKEIIRELFNHEIGHSKDPELTKDFEEIVVLDTYIKSLPELETLTLEEAQLALVRFERLFDMILKTERAAFKYGVPYAQDINLYNIVNNLNLHAYKNLYGKQLTSIKDHVHSLENPPVTRQINADDLPDDIKAMIAK